MGAEGSAWICGSERAAVEKRINEVLDIWSAEHWEMDLEDYGVAMWFLGPKGSGEYAARIASESGAKVKVCPNNLKIWVDGKPGAVQQAKRQIMQGLEQLEKKKQEWKDAAPDPVAKARAELERLRRILSGKSPEPEPRKGKGKGKAKGGDGAARADRSRSRDRD